MKKMLLLVTLIALAFSATPGLAADNLAYKDGLNLGFVFEQNEHDLDLVKVRTTGYGPRLSYDLANIGLHASAAVTVETLKSGYEYYDGNAPLRVDDSAAVSVELSKRIHQFENNFQLGVYGKFKYHFGSPGHSASGDYYHEVYNNNGDVVGWATERFGSTFEIRDLKIIEVGLLAQKDWENIHLYAGPTMQLVRANFKETYWDTSWGSDTYGTSLKEKSVAAGIAGARIDLGSGLSLNVDATFKETASFRAVLEKTLF